LAEPLICLTGPTAAGKTNAAVALAESFDVELISVDSALVYRGLCVGAAQPEYPHHLIDIRDPADVYTAANFVDDTLSCITEARARGRRVVLVGGTMMYYRALIEGLSDMPATDPVVRAEIELEATQVGWPEMHRELTAVDPDTARSLHPNHSQRISRALEIVRQTGIPMSQWQRANTQEAREAVCLALAPDDRATLHARIEARFDSMLEAGFVEEVKKLFDRGDLHSDLPAIRAVGYRQIWSHLSGEYSLEDARDKGIVATRQLAKRQITWLRGWSGLHWIDSEVKDSQEQVKNHLRNYLEAPLS
jgi:tRNA dimethylallyltransferase